MMALIKQSTIQKHPLIWGFIWAGLTLAVICLIAYGRGTPLPNLLIAIPLWAAAGAAWGYSMKWTFDRRGRGQ